MANCRRKLFTKKLLINLQLGLNQSYVDEQLYVFSTYSLANGDIPPPTFEISKQEIQSQ